MSYSTKKLSIECGVSQQSIRNFINRAEYKELILRKGKDLLIPDIVAAAAIEHFCAEDEEQEQEQPQSAADNSKILLKQIEDLREQLKQKDGTINALLEQNKTTQEQLSASQEQLTLALKQAAEHAETIKALQAENTIKTAAENKELLLIQPTEQNTKENFDQNAKKSWWQFWK